MPSSTVPPPPKHGSGGFVAAVIVMMLLMGGLVYWKLGGSDEKQPAGPLTPITSAPTGPTVDQVVPPPPPPPTASADDAGTPSTTKKPPATTSSGPMCNTCGKCNGDAAPGFEAALRGRAGLAQRCYEKALSQQEGLSGKLSVSLCVGVGGGVCNASISSDSLGSPAVAQCVLNIYRATTFPSPKNGCVEAKVPLNFLPEKK
jgi:hypothetical protein